MKNLLTQLTRVTLVATGLFVTVASMAGNPPPTLKVDAPHQYIVKKGDTLWDISGNYLSKPWRWPEIWASNPQVKNPHLIYPGDKLIMCVIQGKQLVGIDDGEGCIGLEKRVTGKAPAKRVLQPMEMAIPAIPLSAIQKWLDRTLVVNETDLSNTPYVLASKNKNIITGKGDKIYVRGAPLMLGQSYGIYREGKPYVDAKTKARLGIEVTQIASGIVTSVAKNGVSSLELRNSYGGEVREGDRVFIEFNHNLAPIFYPKAAQPSQFGQVVRVHGSISSAAKYGVIAINLGANNQVSTGDVFGVYQKGVLVRDDFAKGDAKGGAVRLPNERIGLVMVFKVFDKMSYAYVLSTEKPIKVNDLLMSPEELQ